MKQLIIGIDGGDQSILEQMPMPFLKSLLERGETKHLTEDLLSRGWVEILSGKYARDTKAFYMVPKCDGTNKIVFKYSLGELLGNKEVKPIWEIPGKDVPVAMMNVPTTFPAQPVNGFFVSGAGGGVNKVDGIPESLCHPKSLASDLSKLGYKIDIRFGTAGIKDISQLFDQLSEMLEKRAEAFIELQKKYETEFAFVTFRATTVIQYLAMIEMQDYFERQKGNKGTVHKSTELWDRGFKKLYTTLDVCIKNVFEATNPDNWTVTSDHGAVPYRYRVNINKFMQASGLQKARLNMMQSVRGIAKKIVRGDEFDWIRDIDFGRSKAFGHWYLSVNL